MRKEKLLKLLNERDPIFGYESAGRGLIRMFHKKIKGRGHGPFTLNEMRERLYTYFS